MSTYSFTNALILQERCWPKVEACYSRTWKQYEMPSHFHNRTEIMYVLKGWCLIHLYEYQMDEVTQKILITRRWTERLGPGEFIYLDQGVLHELEVPDTSYILNAEFSFLKDESAFLSIGKLAESSANLTALIEHGQPIRRGKDEADLLMRALEDVIIHFSKSGPKDQALTEILMAELLLRIAGSVKDNSIKANALGYASRAAEYIAVHLTDDIRVDDIARLVGIAPAYLQRIFKQAMGMTIVEYTNQLRIERSKQLLMHTEDSIVDVAIASGFNSRQHFFRVFNSATGISPQQFRQEHSSRRMQDVYIFDNISDQFYDSEGNRRQ